MRNTAHQFIIYKFEFYFIVFIKFISQIALQTLLILKMLKNSLTQQSKTYINKIFSILQQQTWTPEGIRDEPHTHPAAIP